MKILNGLFLFSFLLAFLCCNSDNALVGEGNERTPSCEELVLTELENTSASGTGDTIKAVVYNECKSCEIQSVYTGLIIYSKEDTLARDIKWSTQWTPENRKSREYQLRILKEYELSDIIRVEMYGVCDSIKMDL